MGKVISGFDFLGYRLGWPKLRVAGLTYSNRLRRLLQLYEQKKHPPNKQMLFDNYRRRWQQWGYAGLSIHVNISSVADYYENDEPRILLVPAIKLLG